MKQDQPRHRGRQYVSELSDNRDAAWRAAVLATKRCEGLTSQSNASLEQVHRAIDSILEATGAMLDFRDAMRTDNLNCERRVGLQDAKRRRRGKDPYKQDAHKMLWDTGANSMRQPGAKE